LLVASGEWLIIGVASSELELLPSELELPFAAVLELLPPELLDGTALIISDNTSA